MNIAAVWDEGFPPSCFVPLCCVHCPEGQKEELASFAGILKLRIFINVLNLFVACVWKVSLNCFSVPLYCGRFLRITGSGTRTEGECRQEKDSESCANHALRSSRLARTYWSKLKLPLLTEMVAAKLWRATGSINDAESVAVVFQTCTSPPHGILQGLNNNRGGAWDATVSSRTSEEDWVNERHRQRSKDDNETFITNIMKDVKTECR